MHHSLIRIIKWFCRRLTFNELASAVIIFHEVLSGSRKDIPFKPDEKPPHYRQFRVDQFPPLPAADNTYKLEWELLKIAKESLCYENPIYWDSADQWFLVRRYPTFDEIR